MNILITGGAGFIGSHLVDACIAREHTVAIVDNLSTGQVSNIQKPLESTKATLHNLDITSKDELLAVFTSFQPEVVYHLAAQINVRASMKDPLQDADINISGGLTVLECMREIGCKRIIFASTGGALFDDDQLPYDETMTPSPTAPYGIAKMAFERYLDFYNRQYGFEATILRYANVYGARQNPLGEAGVISIFLNKIDKNETPIIYGDGTQTRDFIHIDDIVSANLHVLEKCLSGIYHVGTGIETSVNELWSILNQGNPHPLNPIYAPALGEIQRVALNPEKLKNTGWRIEKTLNEL